MARIGRALGIGDVAVGVECDRQRQIAKQMACTHAQGYHFGHPGDAVETTRLIRRLVASGPAEPALAHTVVRRPSGLGWA